MKLTKLFLFLTGLVSLLLCGCTSIVGEKTYTVGVDASFFPLPLEGQAGRVFAFSNELLQEIAKVEKIKLVRTGMSWDNLLDCLTGNKCSAILSSLPPNIMNQSKYSFSEPYLKAGVVLVVRKSNQGQTLSDFAGKTIAVAKTDTEIDLMSRFPKVNTIFFDSIPVTLENVASGRYAGCLIPILLAGPYTKDLFQNTLTISHKEPLTNEALRLVTLKNRDPKLIETFNRGLNKLKASGKYESLLEKWAIS